MCSIKRVARVALLIVFSFIGSVLGTDMKYPKTLEQYEMVRSGLAADELASAKNGATNLVVSVGEEFAGSKPMIEASQKLAASESLDDARAAFQVISKELAKLVEGQPGFFVMNCPMMKDGSGCRRRRRSAIPTKARRCRSAARS